MGKKRDGYTMMIRRQGWRWWLAGLAGFCLYILLSGYSGCRERRESGQEAFTSPPGYALDKPQTFILGSALQEISGIVFLHGNPDTVYAIEDENGKLYYFHPGDKTYPYRKFGKKGDYEDLTLLDDREWVVLRSDGTLYTMPLDFIRSGDPDQVREYHKILPPGEYEGLFGDQGGRLIALCKNCPDDDQRREVSGYVLRKDKSGSLAITDHFKIDVSGVKLTSINRKIKFHPSCLARHPLTGQWFLISSVNKVLLVLDEGWKVKASYRLDPKLFRQPEGLAFDRKGNMYISNEGQGGNANILLFPYRQPK